MKPVSTGVVLLPLATSTVCEWPPMRSARSYTVTSCRWLRSQAADMPEIPVPMTAILSRPLCPSLIVRLQPANKSDPSVPLCFSYDGGSCWIIAI